jgi:cyclophilin family peptidyl-prolyl cis-trans isomerase
MFATCAWLIYVLVARAAGDAPHRVGPVPSEVRAQFKLAPFYEKYLNVDGLPVLGSAQLNDYALLEAEWIVRHMTAHRPVLLSTLASNNVRLVIMASNEFTTDVPEHSDLKPQIYWDRRARGLGATPERPAVSGAEENLLCYPNDPYQKENILIHEFAHAIHEMAMSRLDPTFDQRLRAAYESAQERGLWKGTYAATDRNEYWAEGVQSWFDDNRENDAQHNHVNTRAELKAYDSALAALCAEVFGDPPWRYLKPALRLADDRVHLEGYNSSSAPRFKWREAPIGEAPRVRMATALGEFEVELDAVHAPVTTKNFLRYANEGFYRDGLFHRTVTLDNQPDKVVKIEVVQAAANPGRESEAFAPIPLERTRDTGLRHMDGTISMARDGPDSATHEFFICIGDQPELDFGGKRNPDGQGFAAFGKVIRGMDVIRKIQRSPAEGQKLTPPVTIQSAIRER